MPLVSVVTCTYNRAHLIGETIQSVLDQSLRDFEYIIVDDGSTDNTKEIIDSFHDSRIQYFLHERTGGHLSRLRNFAHRHCQGKFIAYIDSDDLWVKTKLERQVKEMRDNISIGFSFTDMIIFNEKKTIRNRIYNASGSFVGSVFPLMIQNRLIIYHTTLVLRKSCLDQLGSMDESLHSGDHDIVFFLSRLFDAFVIYEPLVSIRKHDQNSTLNQQLSLLLMREHHQTLQKLHTKNLITDWQYSKSLAVTSYAFGVQLLPLNRYASARYYFLKCVKITPWNIKAWVRLISVLAK